MSHGFLPRKNAGTLWFFNGSTKNNSGNLGTKNYSGSGAYAGDNYAMTRTAEATGGWQFLTLDPAGAPTLNSQDIDSFCFDPVGGDDTKNFEVDFATFTSVPEPTSAVLLGLAGTCLLIRRRK